MEPHKDKLSFDDHGPTLVLFGHNDSNLKLIERELGVELHSRGGELTMVGDPVQVALVRSLLEQLYQLIKRGRSLLPVDVARAAATLREAPTADLGEIFSDTLLIAGRSRAVTPKGLAQKRYVNAIRRHDIVFGIGPAGTGKTYLAMAMAVRALMDKGIKRIVLCRPAVEAGEKLGFLPGSMAEKVNPYLRPLYDALHDMMDFEKAQRLIEHGTIEVAPLAFMRGRAQPLSSRVLTPSGWRYIGGLAVGDEVIGSDGRATRVLGVYPQGKKDVYRLSASDGASARCCAEHLWAVRTPEDKRDDKPARVLQTRDMIGPLRRNHQHRYELPMLSAPVNFAHREVPIEPYSLGLLLGDGCLTGKTTPSFSTADPELAAALGRGLGEAIAVTYKSGVDYVLRYPEGGRGGLRIANPVTAKLRELGLCGTNSSTKFVPELYLHNSAEVRLAVLQGLLDTDGGPVTQAARTCRVQFTTCSARLRDDVIFLVRSLGGVAYESEAHTINLRLPEGVAPFRLARKAAKYAAAGQGRPMRYVESIEPEGAEECVCIRVAAADALYLTDDFLVTHNTLNDSFVILDEAQNTSTEQMKMFLTRLGYESKCVVTGDVTQVNLPTGQRSGLNEAREILATVEGIAFCHFTDQDVVRHPLVQQVIRAYEKRDLEKAAAKALRAPDAPETK